jgi:hypothetical protein
MISLNVNGKRLQPDADPDTPLLWVLRDHLNLTGTKYGCGMALCGACTVHLNGEPVRSCTTTVGDVKGRSITTIEGTAPRKARRCRTHGSRPTCPVRLLPVGVDQRSAVALSQGKAADRPGDRRRDGARRRCGTSATACACNPAGCAQREAGGAHERIRDPDLSRDFQGGRRAHAHSRCRVVAHAARAGRRRRRPYVRANAFVRIGTDSSVTVIVTPRDGQAPTRLPTPVAGFV